MHAIATAMRRLRESPGDKAFIWANGGYATKHAFGVYATQPSTHPFRSANPQADIDALPRRELALGDDGLAALRTIIDGARQWLSANGVLVLEIGHRQGGAVRELLTTAGLRDVTILHDLAGRDRIATARV
ncbi:MAG: hypothetical protein ACKOE7_11785, partial [Actinomycetota bacterium]